MGELGAFIYALVDPRTKEVRYVGQSKYQETRYKQHIHSFDADNIPKQRWIDELKELGLLPVYQVLEAGVIWSSRFKREAYWINYYLDLGHNLTNQPRSKSSQTREREAYEYKQEKLYKLLEDM
jgi:hypothetical protein